MNENTITKKLREITPIEYINNKTFICNQSEKCDECPLSGSCCETSSDCWVYRKNIFNDNFLNQEVKIKNEIRMDNFERELLTRLNKIGTFITRDVNGKLYVGFNSQRYYLFDDNMFPFITNKTIWDIKELLENY